MSAQHTPAFPVHSTELHEDWQGMSLRDWFAGQALAGLMAAGRDEEYHLLSVAGQAYQVADAMLTKRSTLAAREKGCEA